jgi:hypothetical protein
MYIVEVTVRRKDVPFDNPDEEFFSVSKPTKRAAVVEGLSAFVTMYHAELEQVRAEFFQLLEAVGGVKVNCQACRDGKHDKCKGSTHCTCQHRKSVRLPDGTLAPVLEGGRAVYLGPPKDDEPVYVLRHSFEGIENFDPKRKVHRVEVVNTYLDVDDQGAQELVITYKLIGEQ